MTQIIPAILATSEEEYQQKVDKINSSLSFSEDLVQIDLIDGVYLDNKTVFFEVISKYPLKLDKEVHLMVKEPLNYLKDLTDLSFKRVVFHLGVGDEDKIIEGFKGENLEVGLALNPDQDLKLVESYLDKINSLLIMGVSPGYSGQEFIPQTLEKIKEAASLRDSNGLKYLIGVDGGVNKGNIKEIIEAGVDYVVMGSALFEGDLEENVESIWESIHQS